MIDLGAAHRPTNCSSAEWAVRPAAPNILELTALRAPPVLEWVVPVTMGVATFAAYAATMAPSITWKNGGSDGAELAAAAYVWGVAHPPGYPLYLTLVRLFQYFPMGDPAHRATIFSAVAATAAVLLTYVLTLVLGQACSGVVTWRERAGAVFAGGALAYGPLFWSQSVITEVYTFGAALFALFLLATVRWLQAPGKRQTRVVAVAFALLLSHQPTFAVAALPLAVIAWHRRLALSLWLQAVAILLLCPLLFLTLWLRAAFHPALDWGDPASAARWLAHVTAHDYRPYFLSRSLAAEWPRVPYAVALLIRQAGWLSAILAMVGATWLWAQARAFAALAGYLAGFFLVFAVLYNAQDGQVYLLPTALLLAVAGGIGALSLLHAVSRRAVQAVVLMTLVASVVWQVVSAWGLVSAAGDAEARSWGTSLLANAPAGAIAQSTDEQYTFVLWYLQAAEGLRPDVVVVDKNLVACCPWYRQQLARRYPTLPGPLLGGT